jgi:hypothetical protein
MVLNSTYSLGYRKIHFGDFLIFCFSFRWTVYGFLLHEKRFDVLHLINESTEYFQFSLTFCNLHVVIKNIMKETFTVK